MTAKRLIVTPGEPAGIGAEILLMAAAAGSGPLVTIDDPARLDAIAKAMGTPSRHKAVSSPAEAEALPPGTLAVLPIDWPEAPVPGRPSGRNAPMVIEAISRAAAMAHEGRVDGVVTNPIQKSTLYAAGFDCPGHTEYFGQLDGERPGSAPQPPHPVMLLCAGGLKVAPLTVHVPLADVPALVTVEALERTANVLDDALRRDFGLANPRIAVAGLNPHAGEDGALGEEERKVIQPAVKGLQGAGMHVSGPYPADTLFHEERRQEYDAVIAMYHDQALVPVKTLDFHGGVNATLGLSFIRTSPDHGTALDLAGKHTANPASLGEAIRLASVGRSPPRSARCPRCATSSAGPASTPAGNSGRTSCSTST